MNEKQNNMMLCDFTKLTHVGTRQLVPVEYTVTHEQQQVAQLSQRDRAAGWVSYGQKWKTVHVNGRQHFTDIIGLSSTTMT